MGDKEWTVSHPDARAPLIVRGKNLKEALEKEGLDPNIWQPITPLEPDEVPPGGEPGDND